MALELGGFDAKAARLLAARRIGSRVFLILEWLDPHGKSWFQAVGLIDLDAKAPLVAPIVRLPGEFVADPDIDSLPIVAGKIRMVWSGLSKWGICSIDPSGKPQIEALGGRLSTFNWTSPNTVSYIEEASSGKLLLGRLFVPNLSKRALAEVDVAAMLIDHASPWIASVRDGDKAWMQNLESASKVEIDPSSRAVRCGKFVVVWLGGDKPVQASLYEVSRWQKLAEWKAPK